MDGLALVELLTIVGIALIIPGPNGLTCFAHSGLFGKKANVSLIFGMAIGFLCVELSVGLLVDSLSENTSAMIIMHWVGMLFLLLMVIAMFRTNPNNFTGENIESALGVKAGILMQFVNGKEWAFIIILMTQFIEPLGGGLTGISTIMVITLVLCVSAMTVWTLLGNRLNSVFTDERKGVLVMRVCGSLLGLLWLAFLIQGPQFS